MTIASGSVKFWKLSNSAPKMITKTGIITPIPIAPMLPIIINLMSVESANLKSYKKETELS